MRHSRHDAVADRMVPRHVDESSPHQAVREAATDIAIVESRGAAPTADAAAVLEPILVASTAATIGPGGRRDASAGRRRHRHRTRPVSTERVLVLMGEPFGQNGAEPSQEHTGGGAASSSVEWPSLTRAVV